MSNWTLYEGDCLKVMRGMPSDSYPNAEAWVRRAGRYEGDALRPGADTGTKCSASKNAKCPLLREWLFCV